MNISFAVIFDLDGVIVSTDRFHREGWQRLADELGLSFTEEQAERTKGVDRMASLKVVLGEGHSFDADAMKVLAAHKNAYYQEAIRQIGASDLLPGVLQRLSELEAHGIPMAIGSASKNAGLVLERLGIAKRFAAVVTGNDFQNGKPAPDVFLVAAHRLDIPPSRCLVVEDAEAGVQAALAGGMRALGIGRPGSLPGAFRTVRSLAEISCEELVLMMQEDE